MTLPAGQRLGIYEILAPLGQGGMGEVYRARDTKLGRDVAIKILPELVSGDSERIARFKREAQLLASLNHSNIGGIYGFDESGSTHFLVLELIDGETLADRIVKDGRLHLTEALTIARQLLDALEAAHERGIIHRDLKPANIMLTAGGQVKVLDFGLAKAVEPESAPDISNSPTLTLGATRAGVILGTAAYMSPEQAKGRAADKRSDIWAFGCVLFEMLAGARAFKGEDVSDTLAMVLRGDPEWGLLPPETPGHVKTLIQRCLQRDRNTRLRDVSIVSHLLQEPSPVSTTTTKPPASSSGPWRAIALASIALAALLGALVLRSAFSTTSSEQPRRPMRFEVPLPPSASLNRAASGVIQTGVTSPLALSPDGRELAFVVDAGPGQPRRIWVRPLDSVDARELAGTDGASGIFWSPDSSSIAFFADGALKRIPRAGGSPQKLCDAPDHRGGSWGSKGDIIFGHGGGPMQRVGEAGGVPTLVANLEAGETQHGRPYFLPDGDHFLFKSNASAALLVSSLTTSDRKELLKLTDTTNVAYANGHLVYVLGGALMAHAFDPDTLSLSGEPFRVADQIRGTGNPPVGFFSVSQTGMLAFQSGALGESQMKWLDRTGREQPIGEPGPYSGGVELSADGKRALVSRSTPPRPVRDVWIFDLIRGFPTRLTSDPSDEYQAIWSPTGDRVVYSSKKNKPDRFELFVRSLTDGTEKALFSNEGNNFANSWSPDGKFVFFTKTLPGGYDILAVPAGGGEPTVVLSSNFAEREGRISPDGRWLAYDSNESGREQVYLTPFPRREMRIPVSVNGGADPRWNPNGRELFFRGADGTLMAAAITPRDDTMDVGAIAPLFRLPTSVVRNGYTVGDGGRRFLVVGYKGDGPVEEPIEVTVDWLPAAK